MSRKSGPSRVLAVTVLAMCAGALGVLPPADADPPCKRWRFDGYTELVYDNGGKLVFDSSEMPKDVDAREIHADGRVLGGRIFGYVQGNQLHIRMWYHDPWLRPGIFKQAEGWLDGGLDAGGFAYGTRLVRDIEPGSSALGAIWPEQTTSWRSRTPLKCAVDPPPDRSDVLTPEEGTPLEPLDSPSIAEVLMPDVLPQLEPAIPDLLAPDLVALLAPRDPNIPAG